MDAAISLNSRSHQEMIITVYRKGERVKGMTSQQCRDLIDNLNIDQQPQMNLGQCSKQIQRLHNESDDPRD
jgi:hypothetical protein